MTSPTNLRSEQIKSEFAFERQVQDSAPSAEWSDEGRDLEHWPHNWYVRAALGITLIGFSALAWWAIFKWLEVGSTFLR